ncbi:hypothetical protein LIER_15074 [Lithospermum erythrorhizon]|uniref:Uncharacterized protein n=1 Tax=Lithospermum erythrorhizon TaxID=34254 RepID=A0AAV3Q1K1_LITER
MREVEGDGEEGRRCSGISPEMLILNGGASGGDFTEIILGVFFVNELFLFAPNFCLVPRDSGELQKLDRDGGGGPEH